eukprot:scaffold58447_cov66-Phaeocystis_antarctica.AAC.3
MKGPALYMGEGSGEMVSYARSSGSSRKLPPEGAAREQLREECAKHRFEVGDLRRGAGEAHVPRGRGAQHRVRAAHHGVHRQPDELTVGRPVQHSGRRVAHNGEAHRRVELERAHRQRDPRRPAAPAHHEHAEGCQTGGRSLVGRRPRHLEGALASARSVVVSAQELTPRARLVANHWSSQVLLLRADTDGPNLHQS